MTEKGKQAKSKNTAPAVKKKRPDLKMRRSPKDTDKKAKAKDQKNKDSKVNIDVSDEKQKVSEQHVQLPLNFIAVGTVGHDDLKVYIKQDVYKKIERFAGSDVAKELGSILLGEYCEELGKQHIIISQYIEAKYTQADASTLTFTHETWDYIHSEQERLYPELKIIGWQHTHPSYGIFLSNYDTFIQENFFNLPFQVAYVVDPVGHIRGFFQWKGGKIEKLEGFYIYDDVGEPIKIEQEAEKSDALKPTGWFSNKGTIILTCLAAAVLLALAVLLFQMSSKYRAFTQQQETIQTALIQTINEQATAIGAQKQSISDLQQEIAALDGSSGNAELIEGLTEKVESQQAALEQQEEDLSEVLSVLEGMAGNGSDLMICFKTYTVLQGDSLHSICEKNGIDYASNIEIIKAVNGIGDSNVIQVGKQILLPFSLDEK